MASLKRSHRGWLPIAVASVLLGFGLPATGVGCSCGNSSPVHAPFGDAAGPAEPVSDAAAQFDVSDAAQADTGPDATASGDGGASSTADAAPDGPVSCVLDAGATGLVCSSGCTDVNTDPANCGGCGSVCEAGAICAHGQCANVAGNLEGLRWQLPCTGVYTSTVCYSEQADGSDEQILMSTLSGTSEETYLVTLLFRGVVEEKSYSDDDAGDALAEGAEGGGNAQFFVNGGSPAGDGYNIYQLAVSDPPQTYYLNAGSSGIQNTWPLDYQATIPMNAGATITLTANAIDDEEINNNNGVDGGPVLVPGVPPYPAAFNGQFIQMDVVAVTPQP
jgi:hypothetical protein